MKAESLVPLALKVAILVVVRSALLWLVLVAGGLYESQQFHAVWVNLLVVGLLEIGVVSYVVLRSLWAGRSLCLVVSSMLVPVALVPRLFAAGIVAGGLFSPIVVLVLGKMGGAPDAQKPNPRLAMRGREWAWKVAALVGAYIVLHGALGGWLALVNPTVRVYHAGGGEGSLLSQVATSVQVGLGSPPFDASHLAGWTWLILWQMVRAGVFVVWALPVIRMMKGRWWETPLAVGLLYAIPGNVSLLLPNPYVLHTMRMPLLWQRMTAGLVLGGLAGWLLQRQHVSPRDLFRWREPGEPRRYVSFMDVRGTLKRSWVRMGLEGSGLLLGALLVFVVPCCCLAASLVNLFVCFPSTATQSREYLHAVANGNTEAAFALGPPSTWCSGTTLADARRDVERFGGAELRRVAIETHGGTGSDESIEFGIVQFEYRRVGEETWQRGEFGFMTDHPSLGFCYICSRLSD
jgi:hypothetical protein